MQKSEIVWQMLSPTSLVQCDVDNLCAHSCSRAPYHKMDHLACFTPGMLALGAKYGAVTGAKAEQYMQLGRNLTETCYQMYARQPTGVGTPSFRASGCSHRRIALADSRT